LNMLHQRSSLNRSPDPLMEELGKNGKSMGTNHSAHELENQIGGRSKAAASTTEDNALLATNQTGPCLAAHGPMSKVKRIIDARDVRLQENMSKDEMDTRIAIQDKKYSSELLEAIEQVLDYATWEDYMTAEVVITTEDMQAITRCLLGDSDVDMNEEDEGPAANGLVEKSNGSVQGPHSQGGRKWPDGRVGYWYHSSCGQACRRAFHTGILEIQRQVPCVRFFNSRNGHYLHVRADKAGCFSYVGHIARGAQDLNLARGCQITGIAVHETFHALGINHEQTRADRDRYVTIRWQNIRKGTEHNFQKSSNSYTGSSYDFLSIMHYGPTSFSTNGHQTISPKKSDATRYMGQRNHASQYDVEQLCKFYGCSSRCNAKVKNKQIIEKLRRGR